MSRLKRNREVLQDGKHAQRNKMPTVSLGENNKMYGSLGVMKNSSVFSLQGYHLSMFDGCLFLVRRRGWDVRKKLHQWAGLNCAHSKNMYWNQWAKKNYFVALCLHQHEPKTTSLSLEQITVLSVFCSGVHPEVGINAEDWKLPTKYLSSTFLYLF